MYVYRLQINWEIYKNKIKNLPIPLKAADHTAHNDRMAVNEELSTRMWKGSNRCRLKALFYGKD
jgi:hypothetical protein